MTAPSPRRVYALFKNGHDTRDIAERLGVREADVWNVFAERDAEVAAFSVISGGEPPSDWRSGQGYPSLFQTGEGWRYDRA